MESRDTVKQLITKLKNMAERGSEHEAAIAKTKLENLLKKYGLTIEDALDEQREYLPFKVSKCYAADCEAVSE